MGIWGCCNGDSSELIQLEPEVSVPDGDLGVLQQLSGTSDFVLPVGFRPRWGFGGAATPVIHSGKPSTPRLYFTAICPILTFKTLLFLQSTWVYPTTTHLLARVSQTYRKNDHYS